MRCQIRRTWRQPNGFNVRLLQDIAKCLTELGVAIHKEITGTQKESVERVRQIPGNLFHPVLIGIDGATREVNATSGHFHHKKQIERDQSTPRQNFNRRKVDCTQNVPVGTKERFPGRLSLPLWHRFDSVFFKSFPTNSEKRAVWGSGLLDAPK